ncbi:MAG TPA: FG-GAP-like repeat-containing protein [Vicinamibacterales bacterium]|nr:FG-GAP-like repeat-containing protein [Vicinamibacterales bacterium]
MRPYPRLAGFAVLLTLTLTQAMTYASGVVFTVVPGSPFSPGPGSLGTRGVVVGDFNSDGHNDVAAANSNEPSVSFLAGNGSGTLALVAKIPISYRVWRIAAADFNADGHLDVVAAGHQDQGVSIVFGSATGLTTTTANFGSGGAFDVAAGDLNDDGRPDLVVVRAFPANITAVHLNTGNPGAPINAAPNFTLAAGFDPWGVELADFNGDSRRDILTCSTGGGIIVRWNNGAGSFPTFTSAPIGSQVRDCAVADIDNDGDLDIGNTHLSGVSTVRNDGGSFTAIAGPGGFPSAGTRAALGDVNGDGFADLAATVFVAGQTYLYLSDGFGNLTLAGGFPMNPPRGNYSIEMADMNADGKLDFVIGATWPGVTVMLNDTEIVTDDTPPIVDDSADITVEATGPGGAVVTFAAPAAQDDVDGSVTATCDHASGSEFAIGTTVVECSATDAAGNEGSSSFNIVVQDTIAPAVSLPAAISAELTGPGGAPVSYSVTAIDSVGVTSGPTCSHASGATFGLGSTTVTCQASDAAGNTGTATLVVTVQDTTPPALSLPPAITAPQTGCPDTPIAIPASAADLSGAVLLTSNAPAAFPVGTTIVTFTAVDSSGNIATGSVQVTIVDGTAPSITAASASPNQLWPPNNRLVPVEVTWSVSDCGPGGSCAIVSVSSNEPGSNDWAITGSDTVSLRASRLGSGHGRVYTITIRCSDAAGNASTRTVTVTVPHDKGKS